jgi:glucosamine-6-phosphate deaminase
MRVIVLPDYETLSRHAARIVADAVRLKPELRLALPTGNTPLGMYHELARFYRDEHLDFSKVQTFNLDEYAGLPAGHPRSYRTYMQIHFISRVNVSEENVHIPGPEAVAFEDAIQAAGGLDLLIAGIGSNGHIAFNEPGSPFDSRTREVALAPETRANAAKHFGGELLVPRRAVTMGIGTMLEARRIVLLAHGAGKAAALDRALHGPISIESPASALRLHPNVTVLLTPECDRDLPVTGNGIL